MNEISFNILYLIVNVFSTYTLYYLLNVFMGKERCRKFIIVRDYFFYFVVDALMYLGKQPPAAIFCVKVLSLLYLSKNYNVSVVKRITSVFFMCVILAGTETVVVLLTGYAILSLYLPTKYYSSFGVVCSAIATYMVMLVLRRLDGIRSGNESNESESFSGLQWFCFLCIPISSIVIVFTILHQDNFPIPMVVVDMTLILAINFLLFFLYDWLFRSNRLKTENALIQMENQSYKREIETRNRSWESIRSIRHDMRHHMIALRGMIAEKRSEDMEKYIDEILNKISPQNRVRTGRADIDSIINFKIEEAEQRHIEFSHQVMVPSILPVKEFDIVTILGNLLDNAIHAADEVKENRRIELIMRYNPGELQIKVTNFYDHDLDYGKDGTLRTTNSDKKNHGRGLLNVKRAVDNYDGSLSFDVDKEQKVFSVFVMLFFDEE